MRGLINTFRNTRFMYILTMLVAVPVVIGYVIFLANRWMFRQIRIGSVAIAVGLWIELWVTWHRVGWWASVLTVIVAAVQHGAWYRHDPDFFIVWWRAQWRYWAKYRWLFRRAIRSAGLTSTDPNRPAVMPRIEAITANEHVDLVEVVMTDHQTPELYQHQIQGIRRTLGAVGGRAVPSKHSVHNVTLWLWKTDPLNQIVKPYPHRLPPEDGNWEAWFKQGLAVARLENGDPFNLDLLTVPFHWLLAGVSRSGKSGAIGSLLGAAEWAIHRKVFQIDAIDPAMGMELDGYNQAGLFSQFVAAEMPPEFKGLSLDEIQKNFGDEWMHMLGPDFREDVARCVHRYLMEMRHRGMTLRGRARVFTPSKETPLRALLIDEIATVMTLGTVKVDGRDVNIKADLEEILRQGLKAGFMVLGAVQDPLKSQVEVRDLFTYFTAFGGVTQMGFDKLFGTKAYKAAGEPKIPKRLQGVAFTGTNVFGWEALDQLADEFDETIRVRFTWETDDDIRAMGLNRPAEEGGTRRGKTHRPSPAPSPEPDPPSIDLGSLPQIPALR